MFLCKKKKKKRETSLLLIEENAESAPCLPGEDSSTDLWDCTSPPGVGTGLQITFLIHLWKSLFYKSSLRAAGTVVSSSFVIRTDRKGASKYSKTQENKKAMILPPVILYSSTLWNSSLSFRVRQGLGTYPSMHRVKYPAQRACLSPCTQRNRQTAVHRGDFYSLKSDIMTGATCISCCEVTAPRPTEAPIHQQPKTTTHHCAWKTTRKYRCYLVSVVYHIPEAQLFI